MIVISAPLQQQKMIDLITETPDFTFIEKKGMKLFVETTREDEKNASRELRESIKAQPWGAGLFFQVDVQ